MKYIGNFIFLFFLCEALAIADARKIAADPVFPGAAWHSKTPAALGMDSAKLDQFAKNVGGVGCIVKDGYMVKTWGNQRSKADWASAKKPVVSTLLFFAVEEGLLPSVDALVNPVVRELYGQNLLAKDRSMTFRHLANMVSGYALPETPGTHWGYNDYGINLYTLTLFDGVFRETPDAVALNANRLGALQFQDGSLFSSRSGYGVRTTCRDFARIGWLWLNRGNWNGTQLLPTHYFDNYMRPDVLGDLPRTAGGTNDYLGIQFSGGGTNQIQYGPGIYGFNWWFNAPVAGGANLTWPDAPIDAFQANGHWNKEVMTVIPSLGLVVAARGSWGNFTPGSASASMNRNLKLLADAVEKRPLDGQIMVDPANPRWLVYNRDSNSDGEFDPYFLSGPGDPEGFLYDGTRNADGTRSGNQMSMISKMEGTGANSIYLMAVRSHGGDGDSTQNPFIDSNPSNGFDSDILDQWETWFTAMDDSGITVFFFFYDDSARIWNTGDTVGAEEQEFIVELVDRFEHHRNLIWVVAEEYQERYTATRVSNIAAAIRAADDHKHVIAVHKLSGLSFSEFADDPNIDQFAIQYTPSSVNQTTLHNSVLTAWNNAGGKYNLNMSEVAAGRIGTGSTARKNFWAIVMGGAYLINHETNIQTTTLSDLQNLGRIRSFFEATDFNRMAPHDELAHAGTQYVLARPGKSYIAYASNLSGNLGLKNMTEGTYSFKWFDVADGSTINQPSVDVSAGDRSWPKPSGVGSELAVYITRTDSGGSNTTPAANAQNVTVAHNTAASITLGYSDPDGPGPHTFAITEDPLHGSLSGSGANRTYTPTAGYSGSDGFSFTVNDGIATSLAATVSITVRPAQNAAPVASDQFLKTTGGKAVTFSLSYADNDGPGPYSIDIVTPPTNGTLSGSGNDRTYIPNAGFVGSASYTWRVHDGLAYSNTAKVVITVAPKTLAPSEAIP